MTEKQKLIHRICKKIEKIWLANPEWDFHDVTLMRSPFLMDEAWERRLDLLIKEKNEQSR